MNIWGQVLHYDIIESGGIARDKSCKRVDITRMIETIGGGNGHGDSTVARPTGHSPDGSPVIADHWGGVRLGGLLGEFREAHRIFPRRIP